MLLFNAIARRDTRTLAKTLLNKLGSLIGVISADPVDLQAVPGVGYAVLVQFKLFLDAFTRLHIRQYKKYKRA
ncbi:MAG: hypothetical protein MRQ09_03545 [Candidatus Midichloria sp.]|nr:hypothetical protein [Candidatus Midichloria sp.]